MLFTASRYAQAAGRNRLLPLLLSLVLASAESGAEANAAPTLAAESAAGGTSKSRTAAEAASPDTKVQARKKRKDGSKNRPKIRSGKKSKKKKKRIGSRGRVEKAPASARIELGWVMSISPRIGYRLTGLEPADGRYGWRSHALGRSPWSMTGMRVGYARIAKRDYFGFLLGASLQRGPGGDVLADPSFRDALDEPGQVKTESSSWDASASIQILSRPGRIPFSSTTAQAMTGLLVDHSRLSLSAFYEGKGGERGLASATSSVTALFWTGGAQVNFPLTGGLVAWVRGSCDVGLFDLHRSAKLKVDGEATLGAAEQVSDLKGALRHSRSPVSGEFSLGFSF